MNEIIAKEDNIKNMIYEVRGKQVMLDSDLAKLYQCKNGTKEINQAVKNNLDKFPERYAFRITENEYDNLKSKNLTSKGKGGSRKGHTVFTEQGVAMLATILKSKVATQVSINIMDAFVEMRKLIRDNVDMFKRMINVEYKLIEHDDKINQILDEMNPKELKEKLFYDGQIYDAYSLLINIVRKAKDKIIIIDNYIDKQVFDILIYKNDNVKVEIWTRNIKSNLDIEKFNLQYSNVEIKKVDKFHDRFIILDDNELYHVGASLKDLGKKCFAINKMNKENINRLID